MNVLHIAERDYLQLHNRPTTVPSIDSFPTPGDRVTVPFTPEKSVIVGRNTKHYVFNPTLVRAIQLAISRKSLLACGYEQEEVDGGNPGTMQTKAVPRRGDTVVLGRVLHFTADTAQPDSYKVELSGEFYARVVTIGEPNIAGIRLVEAVVLSNELSTSLSTRILRDLPLPLRLSKQKARWVRSMTGIPECALNSVDTRFFLDEIVRKLAAFMPSEQVDRWTREAASNRFPHSLFTAFCTLASREQLRTLNQCPFPEERIRLLAQMIDTVKGLQCAHCSGAVCLLEEIVQFSGSFVNRYGYQHDLILVRRMSQFTPITLTRPSTENSWFEGYSWRIMNCGRCRSHLGWLFEKVQHQREARDNENQDDEEEGEEDVGVAAEEAPLHFVGLARRSVAPRIGDEEEAPPEELEEDDDDDDDSEDVDDQLDEFAINRDDDGDE